MQLTVESVFSVVGWNDASETFKLTLEIARHGYTEPQIENFRAATAQGNGRSPARRNRTSKVT
jgi:hypothetical protein